MKLLLAFTPFHTPASPPFGLAYLKANLAQAQPEAIVKTVDWNLAFFRRWLAGDMPDLCLHHPTQLVGTVCPTLIIESGLGERLLADLTQLPVTSEQQERYMQAARILDDFYSRLYRFYHDILFPVVEGRQTLPAQVVDDLFGAELAEIGREQPDLVGFSILTEHNLLYALTLGQVIKQRFDIPIALGGAMMSHLDPDELLRAYPWLDFVFFGESEHGLARFVALWPESDLKNIRGLAYREGKAVRQAEWPLPFSLDDLPDPDFSDFPLPDYITPEPVLPIIASRGCYWGKCTFCSHTRPYGGGVRVREPGRVIDEMAGQVARHGVGRFLFVDEAISPRMMRHLSDEIIDRGLDVQFGMEGVRVEEAFDEPLLQQAHKAGLRWVYVGIESANQRLLDLIDKGITIDRVERFIRYCQKVGITPQLSFIVGLPGTTEAELRGEIAFLKRQPMDSSSFVLMLGSPMQQRPEEFGIRIEDRQVLYKTPHGVVHAPRYYFTVKEGLSPAQADVIVEASGPYPKMRPHLGEVHATLLAGTDFFQSLTRPPTPATSTEIAMQVLAQQREAGQVDGKWFLHTAGCLEDQVRLEEARAVIQAGLATNGRQGPMSRGLKLHLATSLNYHDRPNQVLELLKLSGRLADSDPRLCGERARALFALNKYGEALREIRQMLAAGCEIRWIYYIEGLCYERMNRPRKALKALENAEQRDWLEPEINEAKARCLQRMGRPSEAEYEAAKAGRKRRYLT